MENTMEITVFIFFDKLPLIIAKNNDKSALPTPKWRENTLLHMSNRFLEVFLKFQTN